MDALNVLFWIAVIGGALWWWTARRGAGSPASSHVGGDNLDLALTRIQLEKQRSDQRIAEEQARKLEKARRAYPEFERHCRDYAAKAKARRTEHLIKRTTTRPDATFKTWIISGAYGPYTLNKAIYIGEDAKPYRPVYGDPRGEDIVREMTPADLADIDISWPAGDSTADAMLVDRFDIFAEVLARALR
ncbi:hypothetical protein ACIP5Y_29725 [Nocardia sp. NPDC088792]|uniref:hypothetical protein n=1 Tax=Nocardia sp. NPDC088792 TaxID=3364332 RepID=UPI0037FD04EE